MKVKFGDQAFLIEFAYHDRFYGRAGYSCVAEVTTCTIRDGSAPREPKTPAPQLAIGEAVRYFKDPPNREIGRKAALEAALLCLDVTHTTLSVTGNKERRRAFWEVFLNRKKVVLHSTETCSRS